MAGCWAQLARCGDLTAAVTLLLTLLQTATASPRPCIPLTHSYTTMAYPNSTDCRAYTLFDTVRPDCLTDWFTAKKICERHGLELAPEGEAASKASITALCASRKFTCWMDSVCEHGRCFLMSQEGLTLAQGCQQPVRFVCRTKEPKCSPPPSPPSPPRPPPRRPSKFSCYKQCRMRTRWLKPHTPFCDKYGKKYDNYCIGRCSSEGELMYCTPPRDPNVLYLYADGHDYRMYTLDAKQRVWHRQADRFCDSLGRGWRLVPYWDAKGYEAVRALCAANRYTCWLQRQLHDESCPLMAADGSLLMQGCQQDVRFVCRKKRR